MSTKWELVSVICIIFADQGARIHSNESGIAIGYSYSVKFLGTILDFKLNWKSHIQKIHCKLSQACGVLYQIRNKLTPTISRIIYLTLILPYLNYCNVVWASCPPSYLQSLTAIQNKIVRMITKSRRTAPTSPLYAQLKILTLTDIIKLSTALFVFKSLNGIIPSPIQFQPRVNGPYILRNLNPLIVPFSRSSQTQRFLHIRGATLWNTLHANVRSARTIASFKRNIKSVFLNSYIIRENI